MKIVISEKAIREYLRESMFSESGWQHLDDPINDPVKTNPVVDPSAAVTDPENEQTPQNKAELKISLNAMVDSCVDDIDTQKAYVAVKKAIDDLKDSEIEEDEKMKNKTVEETIRLVVRKMIREAAGAHADTGLSYSGDMTSAPSGYEWCGACEGSGELDNKDCVACRGTGKVKKDSKYITSKDTGGASVADMVAAGIPQGKISGLMKSSMEKFKARWPKEQSGELDVELLSSVPEYIEYLKKQAAKGGDPLTTADVQLMNDHPEIVMQSDDFREFFNKYNK
jgi:hypothetical protein